MATLKCRIGTGVSSYVVHVAFSTATDPYPNGATITSAKTLENVKDDATVTIRASETVCSAGYTFPVYVYTSPDGTHWTQVDYLQSGTVTFSAGSDTKYVRVGPATAGTTASYKVKVVLGTGITEVSYVANSTNLTNANTSYSDFTVDVGKGGYLYIGIARYTENYTYPVTASASFGTSSWTVVGTDGKYADHKISAPSRSGTRTVTLTATQDIKYYYQVHAFANGGYFSNAAETDYYTLLAATREKTFDFDLSTLTTPKRTGYTFKGWGYTSNATTYYTDTMQITVTSTSSSSPTIYNLYAIWEAIEYSAYVKLGAGISSAMVQVDGVSKVDIRDSEYHRVVVTIASTITIAAIGLKSGYGKPYTVKFYASESATTPSSSLSSSDSDVSYDYTTSRVYAEITATKGSIDLFYWDSESTDSLLIAAGQPISNMTAARWKRFKAKTAELAAAEGGSYSYSTVASGDTFYATEFNAVRTAIMNRSGYGTLPAAQSSGNSVKASLFEGSGSLKTALNAAITHYNNS